MSKKLLIEPPLSWNVKSDDAVCSALDFEPVINLVPASKERDYYGSTVKNHNSQPTTYLDD